MADWANLLRTENYLTLLETRINDRDLDAIKMLDGITPTNTPTGAKRWNATNKRFESWNGTAWVAMVDKYAIDVDTVDGYHAGNAAGQLLVLDGSALVPLAQIPATLTGKSVAGGADIAVADGGTGASDAATARANLGCGSMATQNSSAVSISGGSMAGTTLTLKQGTAPAPTAEGDIQWDTDDDKIIVGDSAGQKVFSPDYGLAKASAGPLTIVTGGTSSIVSMNFGAVVAGQVYHVFASAVGTKGVTAGTTRFEGVFDGVLSTAGVDQTPVYYPIGTVSPAASETYGYSVCAMLTITTSGNLWLKLSCRPYGSNDTNVYGALYVKRMS